MRHVTLCWHVPAAHGDHDIGGQQEFLGPRFGELSGDVDPGFGHGGADAGNAAGGGLGSAGADDSPVPHQVGEPAKGHLGAARVVHAREQHGGDSPGSLDPGMREGPQTLAAHRREICSAFVITWVCCIAPPSLPGRSMTGPRPGRPSGWPPRGCQAAGYRTGPGH